jgi:rfaE bifunctional protein nucleotidyltransferase chain/domain
MIFTAVDLLAGQVAAWRATGARVVFTNGVFDILHLGHVTYLQEARKLGEYLVVGINSDESVRRLGKGPERPVNPSYARAAVIDALACVDAVIVFGEDTPIDLIRAVMPDVLVKGGDYDPDESDQGHARYIVGSDLVKSAGGQVISIPVVEGYSTTGLIHKMRR